MFLLFISCFSVILLSKSLSSKNPKKMHSEWRLFPPLEKGFSTFMLSLKKMKTKLVSYYKVENEKEVQNTMSLLDLPELTFECILDRLSPAGLCAMAGVCSSFRERCISDHLWEKHMKQKWGRLMGNAAYREWQWHMASTMRPKLLDPSDQNSFSWFNPKIETSNNEHKKSDLPVYSIMSLYISLETGKFCFPAQVYNRENGHAGFMLSCYDAKLTYDSRTDTFQARYSPHGRRTTEENISWDRLRAPQIDTCSYDLHISDSLLDLKPGDHIEIQWRRSKEFPYGWWYGVVGHMESCDGSENQCRCQYSDRVMLEFKQYPGRSRWRKTWIKREDHREVGNESDGFYGGIRKLYKEEEISMWKRFNNSYLETPAV